jgi:hypothetical protein
MATVRNLTYLESVPAEIMYRNESSNTVIIHSQLLLASPNIVRHLKSSIHHKILSKPFPVSELQFCLSVQERPL